MALMSGDDEDQDLRSRPHWSANKRSTWRCRCGAASRSRTCPARSASRPIAWRAPVHGQSQQGQVRNPPHRTTSVRPCHLVGFSLGTRVSHLGSRTLSVPAGAATVAHVSLEAEVLEESRSPPNIASGREYGCACPVRWSRPGRRRESTSTSVHLRLAKCRSERSSECRVAGSGRTRCGGAPGRTVDSRRS